jgi:hypothetical protein
LFIQRQLREMLNKDKDRVDRIWLVIDDQPINNTEIQPLLIDATVMRVSAPVLRAWLGDMSISEVQQHLFVIDPQGHAMLRMPANMTGKQAGAAKGMLQKLLMASAVWDKPGR